jgi:hypothetical protein
MRPNRALSRAFVFEWTHEAVVIREPLDKERHRQSPSTRFLAQDHSTRPPVLPFRLLRNLAARSAVMSEALIKAESNGDPNGIRTRVTAVKGRCPRPLDDRVTKPPNIPFDSRKATSRHLQSADARSTISCAVRAAAPRCVSNALRAFRAISSRSSGFARRADMASCSSVAEFT